MAFVPPPSFAMDATAGSGGPSTVLPQIVTGSPEAILAHVTQMLKQASTFVQLIEQFEQAGKQLEQAWSGKASESATKKISDTLTAFKSIVDTIEKGAQLLQTSSTLVQTAQTAYQSVVSAVNPTVASLMSNPWTYSAAVALSTSTSATLRGFIEAVGGVLKALGAGQLAQTVTSVGQIIGDIEKLFGSGSTAGTGSTTGSTAGSTPTDATVGSTPVTAPAVPQTVASSSGQQAATAAGGTGTTATGYDTAAAQSTAAASSAAAQQNAATAAQTAAAHQAALVNQGLAGVDPGFGSGGATAAPTPTGATPTSATVTPTATTPGSVPTAATAGSTAGAGGVPTIDAAGSGWIATDPGTAYGTAVGSYADPGVYAGASGSGAVPGTGFAADGTPYGWNGDPTAGGLTGAPGHGDGGLSITADSGGHITSIDAPSGHDYDITISTTVDGVTTSQHAVIDDGAVGSS